MIYQIKSYIKFLIKSTNQHGVHSPFVYQFITQCFYNNTKHSAYTILKNYRNYFINSNEKITITDFGRGSKVFKTNHRKLKDIAKNAGISLKRQRLLFNIANYFKPQISLELGTSLGIATAALALGNTKGKVITIEGCPKTAEEAQKGIDKFQLKNISLINKTFEDFFENEKVSPFNLVYIDGNHNKEKTMAYFEQLLPYCNNDTVLIFDDIYWSKEMQLAWQQIYQSPKVTVSIDCFYWGLVFFRTQQPKQHFYIRL